MHFSNTRCSYVGSDSITVPGFALESNEFRIELISVTQDGVHSYAMEYETDWGEVMSTLMLCLETFPTDVERTEQMAKYELESWAKEQDGGEKLNLSMEIIFSERFKPLTWIGGSKDLRVKFSDKNNTTANFVVIKKRLLNSLRDLAAEKIASSVESFSSVSVFQLPILLRMNVKKWYLNQWNFRYFSRKMHHHLLKKEALKRVSNEMHNMFKNSRPKAKRSKEVKRLDAKAIWDKNKKKSVAQKCINLGRLTSCPVCEKRNLKNVKLHISRSKSCKSALQETL